MPRDAAYVAVYDVSEDRERRLVAKVLEGYGLRVQYSAFELRLTPTTRQTLLRRIEALRLESGFLYLYRRAGGRDRVAAGRLPDDSFTEERHAWILDAPTTAPRRLPGASRSAVASRRVRANQPPVTVNPVLPSDFALSAAPPLPAATASRPPRSRPQ